MRIGLRSGGLGSARALVLGLGFSLAACSAQTDALKKNVADLQDSVMRLQNSQDRLQERVVALELRGKNLNAASTPQAAATPSASADPPPRLRVVKLEPGQSQDLSAAPSSEGAPRADDDADAPRPVIRAEGERYHEYLEKLPGGSRARVEYDAALELVRGKQYDAALHSFRRFLRFHPRDALAENALFWSAECEYQKRQYVEAERGFEEVVQRYPRGRKAPDALLKRGLCQAELGHVDDARASFALLSHNYPSAAATRRIPEQY
jgi:tol-pal system protein YbgF